MTDSGAYQLILEIKTDIEIKIGALGIFLFPQGFYIYTGSAMKNLHSRVERHCRRDKKIRWHIDYLTTHRDVEILQTKIFPSTQKEECKINLKTLSLLNAQPLVRKFGSSDCKKCPTHLLYIGKNMPFSSYAKQLPNN